MDQVVYPYSMLPAWVGRKEKLRELIPGTSVRSGYRIDKSRSTFGELLKCRSNALEWHLSQAE
jgi:hypothetical protein